MSKGTNGCMYNCGDSCTRECMKPMDNGMNEQEIIKTQQELIDLLYSQVVDLSMMSKIELGDDVIAEIKRLRGLLNEKEN